MILIILKKKTTKILIMDKWLVIGFVCIIISFLILFFYVVRSENECISSPLTYGARYYQEQYNVDVVIGTLTLIKKPYTYKTFYFDNMSVKEK